MYMDADSILWGCDKPEEKKDTRWFSSVEHRELNREELWKVYGCWAEDAAAAGFLVPVSAA